MVINSGEAIAASDDVDDVILTPQDAVDPSVFIPPSQRKFGGNPDVEFKSLRFRVGRRPAALNLFQLYKKSGRAMAPAEQIDVYNGYGQWLVLQSIGIFTDAGDERVEAYKVEVAFTEAEPVSIRALCPQTKFVTRAEVGLGLGCNVDVALSGAFDLADVAGPLLGVPAAALDAPGFDAKAKFEASGKASVIGRLSFAVQTASIITIGTYDCECCWRFARDGTPLLGEQLLAMIIRTPRHCAGLRYAVRLTAELSTRTSVWPWWRETAILKSKSLPISCPLR